MDPREHLHLVMVDHKVTCSMDPQDQEVLVLCFLMDKPLQHRWVDQEVQDKCQGHCLLDKWEDPEVQALFLQVWEDPEVKAQLLQVK